MPVLRINATSQGLALHEGPAVLSIPGDSTGPVVIMLHGYKYAPSHPGHSPHEKIFNATPAGWPAQLGFDGTRRDDGLGIAFGWYARGHLSGAFHRATRLGQSLAVLIAMLKSQAPQRPVHVVAHSLGAQAALSALKHLPRGAVDRMILLTGAAHAGYAEEMLDTPAGRGCALFNITSRENDLFDLAFERLVPGAARGATALGQGIAAPNACTLQLDCPLTLAGLAALGFEVAPPRRRVCHWSAYTRPGAMAFYAALLRQPDALPLAALQAILPETQTPRWSRLTARGEAWPTMTPPAISLALRAGKRMMPRAFLQGKSHEPAY